MRAGVLAAVGGRVEAELVAAIDGPATGVQVVRRCADLAEVTALAIAGVGRVVVLGSRLPGTDRAALTRLRDAGARVVLLAEDGDAARCRSLGAEAVLALDASADEVLGAVQACARSAEPGHWRPGGLEAPLGALARSGARADERRGGPADAGVGPGVKLPQLDEGGGTGRIVAVWGPHGAPGRTTVAVNLAAELAAAGERVLLVDADTWGGCVGQTLGLLDESPGIAAATRAAANGVLDGAELARLCPVVEPGLRVLTGLTRPDRWRELAPTGLDVVWETARAVADWTVVDCGFSLEDDAGSGFEAMLGPRRNGATLGALAAADVVVAVGAAEPVGIQRLVQGLAELSELALPTPGGRRVVVVNRVRASAAGPAPERAVTEALVRYADVEAPLLIPDDRPALDRAMLEGATLRTVAPDSPARAAIEGLAAQLAARPALAGPAARPGRAGRRRAAR